MNFKLYIGILLPLAVIVILVALSNSGIGLSVERETKDSVAFSSLFSGEGSSRNKVVVQTITISNDFFMPRKYELPRMTACLNDKDGIKKIVDLRVMYSKAHTASPDYPVYDAQGYYYSSQSIELPANSKKQVEVLVEPRFLYEYNNQHNATILSYREYDEILLAELEENRYVSCAELEDVELNSAAKVEIIK